MIAILIAVGVFWAIALTVAVLALYRHLAVVQIALQQRGASELRLDLDADGLDIGSPVPSSVAAAFGLESLPAECTVIIASATCGSCLELFGAAATIELEDRPRLVAIAGDAQRAKALASMAGGIADRVIYGSDADIAISALAVSTSPFVFTVSSSEIAGKKMVRQAIDIRTVEDEQRSIALIGNDDRPDGRDHD